MIGNVALLLLITALAVWMAIVVVHAIRTGEMWARGENIYRANKPVVFWISFSLALVGLVFAVSLSVAIAAGVTRGW